MEGVNSSGTAVDFNQIMKYSHDHQDVYAIGDGTTVHEIDYSLLPRNSRRACQTRFGRKSRSRIVYFRTFLRDARWFVPKSNVESC